MLGDKSPPNRAWKENERFKPPQKRVPDRAGSQNPAAAKKGGGGGGNAPAAPTKKKITKNIAIPKAEGGERAWKAVLSGGKPL